MRRSLREGKEMQMKDIMLPQRLGYDDDEPLQQEYSLHGAQGARAPAPQKRRASHAHAIIAGV